MFAYIRPVNCNVQILNDIKASEKYFGLVIIKYQKIYHYTTLAIIIHGTKHKNTISQIELKHYNQLIRTRTETLRWLQITTDRGNKTKFETKVKKNTRNY